MIKSLFKIGNIAFLSATQETMLLLIEAFCPVGMLAEGTSWAGRSMGGGC